MQQWYGGAGQRQPNPHNEWCAVRTIESEPVAMSAATAAKQISPSTSLGWAVGSRPSRFVPVLPPDRGHALLPKQAFGMGGTDGQHRQVPYLISGGSVYIGWVIVEGFMPRASGAMWEVEGLDAGVMWSKMETTCSTWGLLGRARVATGFLCGDTTMVRFFQLEEPWSWAASRSLNNPSHPRRRRGA